MIEPGQLGVQIRQFEQAQLRFGRCFHEPNVSRTGDQCRAVDGPCTVRLGGQWRTAREVAARDPEAAGVRRAGSRGGNYCASSGYTGYGRIVRGKHAGMEIPRVSRPYMPGYGISGPAEGSGLLQWSWAAERLTAARNYWVATVWPTGRPHLMPVWGMWDDSTLWFSSAAGSRKTKNLRADPHCVISTEFGLRPGRHRGHGARGDGAGRPSAGDRPDERQIPYAHRGGLPRPLGERDVRGAPASGVRHAGCGFHGVTNTLDI